MCVRVREREMKSRDLVFLMDFRPLIWVRLRVLVRFATCENKENTCIYLLLANFLAHTDMYCMQYHFLLVREHKQCWHPELTSKKHRSKSMLKCLCIWYSAVLSKLPVESGE